MYCEQCGSFINDGESFCSNCGAAVNMAGSVPVSEPAPAPAPAPGPAEYAQPAIEPIVAQPYTQYVQPVQPVYQQPVQPVYQQPAYQQPVMITPFPTPKRNVFATVGMILGIVTAATYWTAIFNMLPGIAAIILCIIGITKKDCGGKGKCIAGFITAGIGILLGIIAFIGYLNNNSY